MLVAYLYDPSMYEFNFKPESFIYLLLIAIILLPFQTSFEEYLVRGYLLQGIGIITKSKLLALLIPTFLFALLHLANPEVDKMGYGFLGAYFIMGLVWGVCTLMDDGLELALGMHYGNNFVGILLMTADWTVLQTDSVLKYVGEPNMSMMFVTSIPLQILILIYFSKKYNWVNWREKLFGSVQ
jgi:membrane protease YdiL (CAAX protease family)